MTPRGLVGQSLRHYWRTNLGVVLGVAVAAAVLVGALVVGDSVRSSLREQTLQRIGRVDLVLSSGDRFFRDDLAGDLGAELGSAATAIAPVLQLGGIASSADATVRAGGVQVLGVDTRFFDLALEPSSATATGPDEVLLNERLARRLGRGEGDEILLRVQQPSAMPRDLVMATTDDIALALRVRITGLVPDEAFGRFGLQANQVPPLNAFVSLPWLQEQLDLAGRANLLLLGRASADVDAVTVDAANDALTRRWTLADGELELAELPDDAGVELISRRIFIDAPVGDALDERAVGLLTYFVNELRAGERATPYSMVTAVGELGGGQSAAWMSVVPADLADDEIVINDWLAADLRAVSGDDIELRYFVPGPGRRLVETSACFRVRQVVPIDGPADDQLLMPEFPGLADAEHCRDWEPGIPIDLERVRDEDEAYWDEYRGTPKAFVTLDAGRRLWSNRFGDLTAVRTDAPADTVERELLERLSPASLGLFFRDLRGPALAAGAPATDFGGLFLGLSIFLIAAALLLTALVFVFGVEQRSAEIGTLMAVGFRTKTVRRLLLAEALALAFAGAIVGGVAGLGYTRLVLWGLGSVWRDAVGPSAIGFHARPLTVLIGFAAAIVAAVASIWLTLRRQVRRSATELMASSAGLTAPAGPAAMRAGGSLLVAIAGLVLAVGIIAAVGADRGQAAAGAFFGAGALLLISGLAACRWLVTRLGGVADRSVLSVASLGVRNGIRRRGRSLATIALLACGSFLVVAVGANRLDPLTNADARDSGTGGFALFGQSTLGVLFDLNDTEGREAFGLGEEEMRDVEIVAMRVREGDEASCLNLSQVHRPRLVGVRPEALASRDAFRFAKTIEGADPSESPWLLLDRPMRDQSGRRSVPAIGDQASVTWVMRKKLGEAIEYEDERGQTFDVLIVATVANSILQGNLLIGEEAFEEAFPSESGTRMFLVDAPAATADEISRTLSSAMRDVGMELTPTVDRLAEFNSVQNTYLAIFQVLGGLGLLLGSAGLGMVVARNVLERRGELALLRAVGFRVRSIRWMVLSEHGLLLLLGLLSGTIAAIVAVLPAISSPGADVPYLTTAVLLVAILVSGALWVWLATMLAVRGRILGGLRNE